MSLSNKSLFLIVVLAIGVLLVFFGPRFSYESLDNLPTEEVGQQDFKNVTFTISGEQITLDNGEYQIPVVPDSFTVRTVRYFGNELIHDIDGDGDLDVVFLVTDDGGGSGTFYYVVGAIKEADGYQGTQAMFLGDRIAPQSTDAGRATQVVVNFADRPLGEPMSTQPSVGKSMYILYSYDTNDFGEVVQNFEGESNLPETDKSNLIVVTVPSVGAVVTNPVKVAGQARGSWFFEASFPLIVTDWDGRIIGEGFATADDDWMTKDFVPFTGSVSYDLPVDTPYKRGTLIFKKDNPSGLPRNDDALEVSILFE